MSLIDQRISSAQWRLWVNRYLRNLGTCLLWAGLAWIVAVLVRKVFGINIPLQHAAWISAAAAALASLVWLILTAEDRFTAAMALDQAGSVKERLSTALYLRASADPFAQATVADAEHTASMLQVRNVLPVRYPKPANLAAATWILAVLLFWLLPTWDVMGKMQADLKKKEQTRKIDVITKEVVKPKVDEIMKRMQDKGLLTEDMKSKLEDLGNKIADLTKTPEKMSVEPIKPMTALKEEMKQEQTSLQKQVEGMQSALNKLSLSQMDKEGLVGKLSKELAGGNLKEAKESLKELQAKVQEAAKDPAKAADLAKEMEKLAAALQDQSLSDKLAKELKAAGASDAQMNKLNQAMKQGKQLSEQDMKDLQQSMKQQGLSDSQISETMQKLSTAMKGAQMANKLGQSLSDAAAGMKQGQQGKKGSGQQGQSGQGDKQGQQADGQGGESGKQGSGSGMAGAQQQLSEMEALQSQSQEMEALLADVQSAQSAMNSAMGQTGQNQGGNLNSTGNGSGSLGRGQGGARPAQKNPTAMTPSKVKGLWQNGKMIGEYFDDSQQVKGESRKELVDVVTAAEQEAAKTIDEHKLPPQYDKAVQGYFNELRQLEQSKKPAGQ